MTINSSHVFVGSSKRRVGEVEDPRIMMVFLGAIQDNSATSGKSTGRRHVLTNRIHEIASTGKEKRDETNGCYCLDAMSRGMRSIRPPACVDNMFRRHAQTMSSCDTLRLFAGTPFVSLVSPLTTVRDFSAFGGGCS